MFILLGIFVGLLAAVPLGPVNVFVVSQALKRDFSHGLLAGMTAAALDTVFCFVALAGFFQIKLNLPPYATSVLKVTAALIILVLSAKLIHDSHKFSIPRDGDKLPSAAPKPILGVLVLYVSNPTLYMFWVAVAGAVTGHHLVRFGAWTAVAFAAAVGMGSMLWYLSLVRFVSRRQHRIKPETFRKALFYLGLALAAFAIYTLGTVFI
jgi:threonine/homoserine/homoserine lactone efflux protein